MYYVVAQQFTNGDILFAAECEQGGARTWTKDLKIAEHHEHERDAWFWAYDFWGMDFSNRNLMVMGVHTELLKTK
ncbi:hypothetical protein KC887_02360 [Candidatus Kaiserbacteria bacterium]|nr:hypothetical protein [Candidatus Kaiserbacteria bacterium]